MDQDRDKAPPKPDELRFDFDVKDSRTLPLRLSCRQWTGADRVLCAPHRYSRLSSSEAEDTELSGRGWTKGAFNCQASEGAFVQAAIS